MPTSSDKHSGAEVSTTGHSWDGIEEYNKPLPKWWLYVFYATIVWSIGYYVLYPSWPWVNGYLGGVLGYSQRVELENTLAAAREAQGARMASIDQASITHILADPNLRAFATAGGKAAFADNCAPCHGPGGGGRTGFPSLADDAWLWGGSPEAIEQTVRYGIRSNSDETRMSEMPAFGADNMLDRSQIDDVAEYVLSLSGRSEEPEAAAKGKQVFLDNCSACHGENGKGNPDLGAPNLSDSVWLYSGEKEGIVSQVVQPHHGVMPAWVGRLESATIKMLTVYVHSLGGGE